MSKIGSFWNLVTVVFIGAPAFSLSACEQNTASFAAQRGAHALDTRDLQLGESVHWSEIQQALVVPGNPM